MSDVGDEHASTSLDGLEANLDEALAGMPSARARVAATLGSLSLLTTGGFTNSLNAKKDPKAAEYGKRYREVSRHTMAKFLDSIEALIDERIALALKQERGDQ